MRTRIDASGPASAAVTGSATAANNKAQSLFTVKIDRRLTAAHSSRQDRRRRNRVDIRAAKQDPQTNFASSEFPGGFFTPAQWQRHTVLVLNQAPRRLIARNHPIRIIKDTHHEISLCRGK